MAPREAANPVERTEAIPAETYDVRATPSGEPTGDETRRPFRWPPKPLPEAARAGARDGAGGWGSRDEAARPSAPWWVEIERVWLAPTAEPLQRRVAAIGWSPDAPDAYCDLCGETVGPYETNDFGCAACRDRRLWWERFVRLGEYAGPLAGWIREVKFTRWRRLGVELGRLLGQAVRQADGPTDAAIVPVSASWRRRLARGLDQARAIADGVGAELDRAPVVNALRRRHGPSQRAVPPSEREVNVRGVFRLRSGVDLTDWPVILVDDVRTSGATLRSAARELRQRGGVRRGQLWVAAVAVASDPTRRTEDAQAVDPDATPQPGLPSDCRVSPA